MGMTPALPMPMRRMVGRETVEGTALWFSRQRKPSNRPICFRETDEMDK